MTKKPSYWTFFKMIQSFGISQKKIIEWAKELGFVKRDSAKFDPTAFFAVLCLKSQVGSPSYNDQVAMIEATYGISLRLPCIAERNSHPSQKYCSQG